jgi:hypothetical protein
LFKELKDILRDHLTHSTPALQEKWIFSQWNQSVGRDIASKTAPFKLSGETLFVNTANSVWSAHLSALKENLITSLNSNISPFKIKDIRFRVAYPLRPITDAPQEAESPLDAGELEKIALSEEERSHIELIASDIADPDLRRLFLSVMTREEKLKKAKLNSGWKKCSLCSTIIDHGDMCPFCKIEHGDGDNSSKEPAE